ncbi:MAG TPA: TIR domain-containing protein [Mycobacteriales bacterium]|nr:TIR domain-containing protein [Mycobacteriales bacterium]
MINDLDARPSVRIVIRSVSRRIQPVDLHVCQAGEPLVGPAWGRDAKSVTRRQADDRSVCSAGRTAPRCPRLRDHWSVLTYADQLRSAARELEQAVAAEADPSDADALQRLLSTVDQFERASSGSNFGFHSCVYYKDFKSPPPGAHFSSEWGFNAVFAPGSTGDWVEYNRDDVTSAIHDAAGTGDLDAIEGKVARVRTACEAARATAMSVLSAYVQFSEDEYVANLKSKLEAMSAPTEGTLSRAALARFNHQMMSRDAVAIGQGIHLAPHEVVGIQAQALQLPFDTAAELSTVIGRAADHIDRITQAPPTRARQIGTRVFIGHGRSPLWRELKDLVADRLQLPYDEFNRVPVAGTTNIDRLSEMIDNATAAFLILTAEDERIDGTQVARQNVVHEAGLFQGRLGFSRAIIMLEEGCEPFQTSTGWANSASPPATSLPPSKTCAGSSSAKAWSTRPERRQRKFPATGLWPRSAAGLRAADERAELRETNPQHRATPDR